MRKVEHRLRLDLLRGGNQGYIRVKRGENGARRLAIALYMHSVPYMADAGTTAVFRAIKPDNTKLFNSATITDNVVTVGLTTQTVAALGTVRCELSIYGTNNELLYSPQFDIIVEDYLYSDTAIESTDEYTDLTEAISKVNNIVSTEADRVAAENQRVANETARGKAETERETAETARAEAETARVTAETERASAETTRASAESSRAFSENIRKQAEKQRVSSETQRGTAETARSTAESGRRSAETARVQEFNAIKADAQDAATAEAARALAEELRMALYNQWDNATASVKGGKNIDVNVVEADGHKNFDFTIPSDSLYCETRTTITNGDLETIAREHARTIIVFDLSPIDFNNENPTDYGLPADIAWNFTLINGPSQNVGTKNYFISYPNATVAATAFVFACPQILIDGKNIYMRRLSYWDETDKDEVSHWKFEGEDWEPVGGTADAVTYTPQTLTEAQQKQARANIGAGQPLFVVNVTEASEGGGYTADKTAAEIEAAYQAGRTIVCKTQARFLIGYIPVELPLVSRTKERVFSFAVDQLARENVIFAITVNISDSRVEVFPKGVEIYGKPTSGIPKSDLAEDVQTSLDKADTAISLGLTAATPGQIIKVKTVQDGKPTEWEAVDMPSQPDWNQNDNTKPDYIKNRPFYTGNPVETVLVEESTVQFTDIGGVCTGAIESTFSPTVGNAYKVYWDGTDYESACVEVGQYKCIGNLSIDGSGPDTGEPFLMYVTNQGIDVATLNYASYHTISISRFVPGVVKIDEKYLPELPYMDKVNPTGTGAFSLNRKADTTIGNYSFAEGRDTTVSGYASHAEGLYTTASGECSHAEGYFTKASSQYQHVHGKYNIEDTSNTYTEIVGNGDATKSSNAHTLDWSGNAWYAGDVYVRSTSGTDKDEGSKKLATEEYVDTAKTEAQQLGLTAATPGQIIKVKTVQDGKPTEWEAVDLDAGKFTKFTKLLTHTITEDELAASPIAFVWGTAQIPNLNDFNVFVLTIMRPDGAKIEFNKWVRFKINNVVLGNICGSETAAKPQYAITANRLFGVWISGNYYDPRDISVPVLVAPRSDAIFQSNLPDSEPVTSIGFTSYAADYGLTAGIVVELWGAK